ncbi:MAG: M36 family metallopeptidase [Deltaproteobacteria bacterium]|nr:M36 family metallopeptidase [Deltaproteobacteria bacterium]
MALSRSRSAAGLLVLAACGSGDGPGGFDTVSLDEGAFRAAPESCPPADPVPPSQTIARRAVHPRAALRAPASAAPAEAAALYLRDAGTALAAPLHLQAVHDRDGVRVVKYRQQIDGVDVFRREVNVVMSRDNALVAVLGAPTASAPVAAARAANDPDGDARRAISAAARDLGISLPATALASTATRGPDRRYQPPRGNAITFARARPTWFDTGRALVAASYVELRGQRAGAPLLRSAVVDARGAILFRNDKVTHATPYAFRVYGDATTGVPAITPFCGQGFPHPTGTTDGYVPPAICPQQLVSSSPVGDPWLPDGATETHGNNVDAYFHFLYDTVGNPTPDGFMSAAGDFRAHTTAANTFDHPYDHAAAPDDYFEQDPGMVDPTSPQPNAKIVQAFYVANYLHDLTYPHGYDEASGNSQDDNFGRGGLGGDALQVYAGALDTYTYPLADGVPPMVVMGRNYRSRLHRDGTLDLTVFAHEWAHVVEFRLIGDTEGLNTSQARSLAEGWSDFFGLLVSTRADQATAASNPGWTGTFATGAYFNQLYCDNRPAPVGTPCDDAPDQSYFFGVRRYPYTVDLAKSPLTFRWIANGVPLPDGIPTRFWKGRIENAEWHSAGELWASALWGAYRGLLVDGRYDFAQAQGKMIGYLIAGMKATPIDPTFLDARDALFAVVKAADPADYAIFKAAFAARGMGAGAVAPAKSSDNFKGAVESTAVDGPGLALIDASLSDADTGDRDGILDPGETGALTLVVRNSGYVPLHALSVEVHAVDGDATVGAAVTGQSALPGEDLTLPVSIALHGADPYQRIAFDVTIADADAGIAPVTTRVAYRVNHDTTAVAVDGADNPVSQRGWYQDRYLPYQETEWARVDHGGDPAYEIAGTRLPRSSALRSPCFQVATDRDLIVRFASGHSENGDGGLVGEVQVGAGGLDAPWQTIYTVPAEGAVTTLAPVEVNLGRDHAGQWLQLQLRADVPAASGAAVPRWTVDDVAIDGAVAGPFHTIAPDGTGAP